MENEKFTSTVNEKSYSECPEPKYVKEGWFPRTKRWISEHPDAVLGVVGGIFTFLGACVGLYASTKACDDYIYIEGTNDDIYRVPAKKVLSAKHKEMINE